MDHTARHSGSRTNRLDTRIHQRATAGRKIRPLGYCLALAGLALLALGRTAGAATPWLTVQGNHIVDPNGKPVILRGLCVIDLGQQNAYSPNIYNVIDKITNTIDSSGSSPGWYPRVLRLPIVPGGVFSWSPNDGDNFYNKLLRPVVNYCESRGLYCIIDLHYVHDIDSSTASFASQFWAYMAPRFANEPNVLFEIYNEPINNRNGSDAANWSVVKSYEQPWVNTIRSSAPKNLILAGTPQWSQILVPAVSDPLSGGNIVYVCHLYPQHWANPWNVNQVSQSAPSIPIMMTEWGFNQNKDPLLNGSISSYGQPLMNLDAQYGIGWTAWVASNSWEPTMFNSDWSLAVGSNQMGGFVKDILYGLRDSNQPAKQVDEPVR
jgi:endoglucanase